MRDVGTRVLPVISFAVALTCSLLITTICSVVSWLMVTEKQYSKLVFSVMLQLFFIFSGMSVLTLALCARLSWLLVRF